MKKISKDIENSIISLLNKGLSSRKIAVQLGISHSTVMRESARLWPNAQKQKAGRPAKLTIADKRNIVRNLTSGKADTAVQLAKDLKGSAEIENSSDIIYHALKEAG